MTPAEFLKRIDYPSNPDGCWLWNMATANGYGIVKVHGRRYLAHRLAWELFVGPIPDGLVVRHLCHNPRCVRPFGKHLLPGTQLENMQDSLRDGRLTALSLLSKEQVREIRLLASEGTYTQAELGERYGVTQGHISRIVAGLAWKEAA